MKIYFAHSKDLENQEEIYSKLESLSEHEFIFPYRDSSVPLNSKEIIKTVDLILAEVSNPSTGLGIELGWADMLDKPMVCAYRTGLEPSRSLKLMNTSLLEYDDITDLVNKIKNLAT